jgi:hypothetical protein
MHADQKIVSTTDTDDLDDLVYRCPFELSTFTSINPATWPFDAVGKLEIVIPPVDTFGVAAAYISLVSTAASTRARTRTQSGESTTSKVMRGNALPMSTGKERRSRATARPCSHRLSATEVLGVPSRTYRSALFPVRIWRRIASQVLQCAEEIRCSALLGAFGPH